MRSSMVQIAMLERAGIPKTTADEKTRMAKTTGRTTRKVTMRCSRVKIPLRSAGM